MTVVPPSDTNEAAEVAIGRVVLSPFNGGRQSYGGYAEYFAGMGVVVGLGIVCGWALCALWGVK